MKRVLNLIRDIGKLKAEELNRCIADRDFASATELQAEVALLTYLEEKLLEDE